MCVCAQGVIQNGPVRSIALHRCGRLVLGVKAGLRNLFLVEERLPHRCALRMGRVCRSAQGNCPDNHADDDVDAYSYSLW
jgi:hypothetical protein